MLKSFADRQHITYPLLSDTDSKIIRAYDILNETTKPGTLYYGIPYPGIYILDAQGRVVAKYFEDDYKDRVSTADILARQFGAPFDAARGAAETKHLQITTAASNGIARPGLRIELSLDIDLKPGMHVYAPGVQGYIPIDWRLDKGGPAAKRHSFEYPASEMLRLEAIDETVPVYRGHIRIRREITFGQEALSARGWTTKSRKSLRGIRHTGRPFSKASLRHLLTNATYCGKVRYRDVIYQGEHPAHRAHKSWLISLKQNRTRSRQPGTH